MDEDYDPQRPRDVGAKIDELANQEFYFEESDGLDYSGDEDDVEEKFVER